MSPTYQVNDFVDGQRIGRFTNNLIFVGTGAKTYAVDLNSHGYASLKGARGGHLNLAEDRTFVLGSSMSGIVCGRTNCALIEKAGASALQDLLGDGTSA